MKRFDWIYQFSVTRYKFMLRNIPDPYSTCMPFHLSAYRVFMHANKEGTSWVSTDGKASAQCKAYYPITCIVTN